MGRTTLYNEEFQKKADDYLDKKIYQKLGHVVPSHAGLSSYLNVHKQTIYNYAKEYDIFFDTLSKINNEQELLLTSGGLSDEYNAQITKLMLANHGYGDAAIQKLQFLDKDGKPANAPASDLEIINRYINQKNKEQN